MSDVEQRGPSAAFLDGDEALRAAEQLRRATAVYLARLGRSALSAGNQEGLLGILSEAKEALDAVVAESKSFVSSIRSI